MVKNKLDMEKTQQKNTTSLTNNNNNNNNNIKETSFKIYRLILCLVLFVSGIVLGLISSSHIDTTRKHDPYFYNSFLHVTTNSNNNNNNNTNTNTNAANNNKIRINSETETETETDDNLIKFDDMVHPKEVIHSMTDEELFWRASMVPRIVGYPYKRVPKVAFMFLTRGPLPFLPIWERFFGGYDALFTIYVHTLPGFILNVSPDSVFFARQIPSQKVSWGDVTMADGEKRLLANALLDFSNERFVLVSESCIPVYNFKTVYKYLTESMHSFVESYDEPTRYGRGRYNKRMTPDIKLYQWRKGSQWFEMSRVLAIEIISDYKYYDLFRRYCHPSCYPDEHYIPTYINMFHGPLNSNRTVTYVDWSLGGPHPANFGRENITESFIQNIRNNGTECLYNWQRTTLCYLFARKFDPSALEPLLELSSRVMGF